MFPVFFSGINDVICLLAPHVTRVMSTWDSAVSTNLTFDCDTTQLSVERVMIDAIYDQITTTSQHDQNVWMWDLTYYAHPKYSACQSTVTKHVLECQLLSIRCMNKSLFFNYKGSLEITCCVRFYLFYCNNWHSWCAKCNSEQLQL